MPKLSLLQPRHSKNVSLGEATARGLLASTSQFKAVLFPWSTVSQLELEASYKLLRDTPQLDGVKLGRSGFIFTKDAADQIAPKLLGFNYAVVENILLLAEYLNLRLREATVVGGKIGVIGGIRGIWELVQLRFYDTSYNLSEFFKRLEWLLVKKAKKRKQILIFSWRDIKHPQAGGAEIYLHKVAEQLRHNYNVTIFTSRPANLYLYDTINGVNIVRRGGRLTVYLYAVIYYLLFFRRQADFVIDVENGLPFFTPLFSRLPKILLVHHVHKGQWLREMGVIGVIGMILECYVMPLVYRGVKVVTVSPSSEEALISLGFNSRRIDLAFNGVGRPVGPHCRKSPAPSLLYLGRLKKYKQVNICLTTFKKLLRDFPTLSLTIAGTGNDLKRLQELAQKLKIADKVNFLGFVSESEKWKLLRRSWLFLMPSSQEGWGVTIIEAALVGTPAVGFDVPGVRDAIRDRQTGLLATSPEDYYNKVRKLLTDQKLRADLAQNGILYAKSLNWKRTAEVIEEAVVNEQYPELLRNKYRLEVSRLGVGG